jgi:predicted amidohydrolase YtcJ
MPGNRQGGKPVELIVEDAEFVTMVPASGTGGSDTGSGGIESMLVRDGRIAAIGPAAAVRAAAGPGAAVARLDGATVIPGLIDAHCHVMNVGYLAAGADCSQPAAPDIPAIKARLRAAADGTPAGSWVTGSGYVEYKLAERRHPTREDLDAAVPDRPAVVYHTSLHACVLNSAALREAGFADGQPDPADGVIGRDGQGRLNGVLFEGPMFRVFAGKLRDDLAQMDAAARARVVRRAGQRLASLGITAACDADLRCPTLAAYAEADEADALSQRIYGLVVHDQVDELVRSGMQGRRSGRLAAQAVKIWADGGMSSRTAAIHGTYPVPPYGSGILYFEPGELTAMVRDFAARGFQVCVHAQGDRAIEIVLDAYAQTLAGTPGNPRRHRIEHGGAMYPALAARAAELRIPVVSQPGFLSGLGDGFAEAFGGQADQLYAFRTWQRAGITVAGSSDAPVITPDPLTGIRDAVVRRTAAGRVLGPDERLAARDALALYTAGGAFAMHREAEIGSLAPGKLADFTVLDRNPLRTDPEQITGIQVLATVVDGTPTHLAGGISFPEG